MSEQMQMAQKKVMTLLMSQTYADGSVIDDFYFSTCDGMVSFRKLGQAEPIFIVAGTPGDLVARWERWRASTPNDDCGVVVCPF